MENSAKMASIDDALELMDGSAPITHGVGDPMLGSGFLDNVENFLMSYNTERDTAPTFSPCDNLIWKQLNELKEEELQFDDDDGSDLAHLHPSLSFECLFLEVKKEIESPVHFDHDECDDPGEFQLSRHRSDSMSTESLHESETHSDDTSAKEEPQERETEEMTVPIHIKPLEQLQGKPRKQTYPRGGRKRIVRSHSSSNRTSSSKKDKKRPLYLWDEKDCPNNDVYKKVQRARNTKKFHEGKKMALQVATRALKHLLQNPVNVVALRKSADLYADVREYLKDVKV